MYPVQNNQPMVLNNNFITNTSKSNSNKNIETIKEALKRGLFILDNHSHLKENIIASHKKNIANLVKLLDSNKIIHSDITITENYANCDKIPEDRYVDELITSGYNIYYKHKELIKIIFIEEKSYHIGENGYSIMSDFSIECYEEFHNLCSEAGITGSSRPLISKDLDLDLEKTELLRKTKQQHTKDFDEEFPQRGEEVTENVVRPRLVRKDYSHDVNPVIPSTTTGNNACNFIKKPVITDRPFRTTENPFTPTTRNPFAPTTRNPFAPTTRNPFAATRSPMDRVSVPDRFSMATRIQPQTRDNHRHPNMSTKHRPFIGDPRSTEFSFPGINHNW
jgi:hypothetical protein